MGVMYDYFSAASDELAASAVGMRGGPGGPVHLPMPVREILRLHGREGLSEMLKPRLQQAESGFSVVSTKGFDPGADLEAIEEILTGTGFEAFLERPRHGYIVAERDNGQELVLTISDETQAVLAGASSEDLSTAAEQWSSQDGRLSNIDAAPLAHLLGELSALARGASEHDEHLYCWICL
jgi:hypothetical protein